MLVLKNKIENGICVNDLPEGKPAVIVVWSMESQVGKIVQRHKDLLLILGDDDYWDSLFVERHDNLRVVILEPGAELVVE